MLHPVLEDAIDSLLACWRHYDDVTRRDADYLIRSAARTRLDGERTRVNRLRRGLHPEAREMEEVASGIQCPSLGVPVFLRHGDFHGDGSFTCPCGTIVGQARHA